MFPTTKPRRSDSFMEPANSFTYYEDLYGEPNLDEFDEGPIHDCESDSDERPRQKKQFGKSSGDRFFRQTGTPKKGTFSEGFERFGEIKRPSKQRQQQRQSSRKLPSSDKRISRQQSSPTLKQPASTEATPKNMFGITKSPAAKMQIPNSAGEELDGLLGPGHASDYDMEPQMQLETEAGGEGGGGGGRRGRPVMLMDPPPSEPDDEGVLNEEWSPGSTPIPPNPYLISNTALWVGDGAGGEDERGEEMPSVQAASDGDVEDNTAEVEKDLDESLSLERKPSPDRAAKEVPAVKQTKPSKKLSYTLGKRVLPKRGMSSSEASTPRRSSRRISQRQAQNSAESRDRRSKTSKAQQIAASNRSRMTARAATLREKAKKKGVSGTDKEEYFQSVYGRKPRASKQANSEEGDSLKDYYKAVYGRKKSAKQEDIVEESETSGEYADVVAATVAKRMERGGEVVEVDDAGVDTEEYMRMF